MGAIVFGKQLMRRQRCLRFLLANALFWSRSMPVLGASLGARDRQVRPYGSSGPATLCEAFRE